MADDFAAIAAAQHSGPSLPDEGSVIANPSPFSNASEAAERAVQLVSRWAGILAFVAAVAGLGYLIF